MFIKKNGYNLTIVKSVCKNLANEICRLNGHSLWENITYQMSWDMTQKCKVLHLKSEFIIQNLPITTDSDIYPGKFLSSIHIKNYY